MASAPPPRIRWTFSGSARFWLPTVWTVGLAYLERVGFFVRKKLGVLKMPAELVRRSQFVQIFLHPQDLQTAK